MTRYLRWLMLAAAGLLIGVGAALFGLDDAASWRGFGGLVLAALVFVYGMMAWQNRELHGRGTAVFFMVSSLVAGLASLAIARPSDAFGVLGCVFAQNGGLALGWLAADYAKGARDGST